MRHVALDGVEAWRAFPRVAEAVQHSSSVVDVVGHGVGRLPQVHVARSQEDQTVQFLGVNGFDTGHLGQSPIGGVGHVVVRQVGVIVHVNGHLHAPAAARGAEHLLLSLFGGLVQFLLDKAALEWRQIGSAVEIQNGIRFAFHLGHIVLLTSVVERAQHVVGHQHQGAHDLPVQPHFERLKLRNVLVLFVTAIARRSHRQDCRVHEEPLQFEVEILRSEVSTSKGAGKGHLPGVQIRLPRGGKLLRIETDERGVSRPLDTREKVGAKGLHGSRRVFEKWTG